MPRQFVRISDVVEVHEVCALPVENDLPAWSRPSMTVTEEDQAFFAAVDADERKRWLAPVMTRSVADNFLHAPRSSALWQKRREFAQQRAA
mmetsp:Transcript_17744/g.47896  ORF Transcript_17744/g.47896 Transcript_17744/m.47896 type:complete len:91 (+) Transcript_17744:88-360(+)